MSARAYFELDLQKVDEEIIALGEMAITAISDAVAALAMKNIELARTVIEHDKELDQKELYINNQTLLMIAKQQPVAKDLRRLITALKIASDLERMGDNAKNIAAAAITLGADNPIALHPSILKMEQKAIRMAELAIKAFATEDLSIALDFYQLDDQVDDTYEQIVQELLSEQVMSEQEMKHVMQMAFCARYIERFADHVTNIAESVIFLIKGENHQLN